MFILRVLSIQTNTKFGKIKEIVCSYTFVTVWLLVIENKQVDILLYDI